MSKVGRPYFLLILLLTSIVTILSVGFFAYNKGYIRKAFLQPPPTTDPEIDNWRTYINTKYNYSIEYPNDWEIVEIGTGEKNLASPKSGSIAIIKPEMINQCWNNPGTLEITPINDNQWSTKHLIDPYFTYTNEFQTVIDGQLSIAGITATKENRIKYSNACVDKIIVKRFIIPANRDSDYEGFYFELDDTLQKDYENLFDQILSTFQFID